MNRPFSSLLVGAALCGGVRQTAHAQPAPVPLAATAGAELKNAHPIEVRNVPPSLMAYWLDAKHHSFPKTLRPKIHVAGAIDIDSDTGLTLPEGVDRIVADDRQRTLMVFGTDAGASELAGTVARLDQPLREVITEVHWVQISRENARALGITYAGADDKPLNGATATPPEPETPQQGLVRGDFQATLAQLVQQNRAQLLSMMSMRVFNNLENIAIGSSPPSAGPGVVDEAGHFTPLLVGENQVGVEHNLKVTPTINNDQTITTRISTSTAMLLATAAGKALIPPQGPQNLESILNLRDGQTAALGTFTQMLTPHGQGDAPSHQMIFVTARIVPRAGNAAVRPISLPR